MAVELGFRHRTSARQAVAAYMASTTAETVDSARRTAAESLRITTAILFDRLALAVQRDDENTDATVVLLNRELVRNRDQAAKLHGAYAPERTEVDVNVRQTPAAIIDRMETELLALARANNTNIIEGEVVG